MKTIIYIFIIFVIFPKYIKTGFWRKDKKTVVNTFYTRKELKSMLTDQVYQTTHRKEMEDPGTGIYLKTENRGLYRCIICNTELFTSDHKYVIYNSDEKLYYDFATFHSASKNVRRRRNYFWDERYQYAHCKNCNSFLGPIVRDKSNKSKLRYLINSTSLWLEKFNWNDHIEEDQAMTQKIPDSMIGSFYM